MDKLRKQLIVQAERIVELLEDDKVFEQVRSWDISKERAEITAKMKEFRRDTLRLEKRLYNK